MSLSGSSASRNSIWAMTRLASSSSMKVGRKMIRSFSRREKMSNARSPRGVCSMTMGTRAMNVSLLLGGIRRTVALTHGERRRSRMDRRVIDQELQGHALAETMAQTLEVPALLHHTPYGRHRPLRSLGDLVDLRLDIGLRRRQPFAIGDGLEQQCPAHGLLRL